MQVIIYTLLLIIKWMAIIQIELYILIDWLDNKSARPFMTVRSCYNKCNLRHSMHQTKWEYLINNAFVIGNFLIEIGLMCWMVPMRYPHSNLNTPMALRNVWMIDYWLIMNSSYSTKWYQLRLINTLSYFFSKKVIYTRPI